MYKAGNIEAESQIHVDILTCVEYVVVYKIG